MVTIKKTFLIQGKRRWTFSSMEWVDSGPTDMCLCCYQYSLLKKLKDYCQKTTVPTFLKRIQIDVTWTVGHTLPITQRGECRINQKQIRMSHCRYGAKQCRQSCQDVGKESTVWDDIGRCRGVIFSKGSWGRNLVCQEASEFYNRISMDLQKESSRGITLFKRCVTAKGKIVY